MILFAVVGCDRGPSVQSSITAGQKHFQPVLDALAKYHEKHARYPAKLDELVREGLLSEIPKTPAVENARPGGPYYRVDDERKSYEFTFSYHLHDQGIGVGDTTYAKWHSASGSWSMSGPGY
jgi:hypothetical protein